MVIITLRFFICSAVLLEGGITATSILFEKYQVTDVVYESDTVTVFIAEHIYMSVKRIIKKILKKSICRDTFYSEVNILKSIKITTNGTTIGPFVVFLLLLYKNAYRGSTSFGGERI